MMKYATGFDAKGRTIAYYRERIAENHRGTTIWHGRVHEAVHAHGTGAYARILKSGIKGVGDKDRNLRDPTMRP